VAFQPGATWEEEGRDVFAALGQAGDQFIRDLDSIQPPEAAQPLHTTYVDSFRVWSGTLSSAAAIEDETEAEAFFAQRESEFFAAVFRAAATCEEMNTLASENQIDVQLPCRAFSAR
jgi:hypothetical protein